MTIAKKLHQALQILTPSHLTLENESHQHAGYVDGKESHFKLTIVSEKFTNQRLIARHQQIYAIAHDFLTVNGGGIHALAIHAYTLNEWQDCRHSPVSPNCAGKNIL